MPTVPATLIRFSAASQASSQGIEEQALACLTIDVLPVLPAVARRGRFELGGEPVDGPPVVTAGQVAALQDQRLADGIVEIQAIAGSQVSSFEQRPEGNPLHLVGQRDLGEWQRLHSVDACLGGIYGYASSVCKGHIKRQEVWRTCHDSRISKRVLNALTTHNDR